MKQDYSFLGTMDELDVRLTELRQTGERLNAEFGKCLDRASLLISVTKSLATDQLNAAKVGSAGIRYDIGPMFEGSERELADARRYETALAECKAEMRDLHKIRRAIR